jgi:transposase
MQKVELQMNEQEKYDIIKHLMDHHRNKKRAALQLNCTVRHINRLIKKYNEQGKSAFSHGNKGRKPLHAISDIKKAEIITIYNNKYWDATFAYACELLAKHDDLIISTSTLTKILYEEYILSPRSTKKTKKRMKKELRDKQKKTTSKKEKDNIQASIVAIEDSHSRRPRCAYFGEMLQMDASVHEWFGGVKTQLHIAIDDSTSNIVGAYFDDQETLNGYYHVFHQILTTHGVPAMFYTDRRTVFDYKKKNTKKIENDTLTQFGYACHQLGVDLKVTSIAQAKGRVERAFQTLQQRLPIALRLAGINSLSEANIFLNSYIKEHNTKFALPINNTKSVFIKQPNLEIINQTLAVITERIVDTGHCIKFEKNYYKTLNTQGLQVHYHKGTKGLVIKTFDKQILFSTNDTIYELELVPLHERKSRNFDFDVIKETPIKRNIPSPKHPWRSSSFLKYRDHKIPA